MKKLLSLGLVLALLLSLGGAALAETAKTEIVWWAFPTLAQKDGAPVGTYEQTLIDAFQEKYPNITVKLETIGFKDGPDKIVTAIQGGTQPDVLIDAPGRIIAYGKNGNLVNLNDLFTDELKKDIGDQTLIDACSDGKDFWMYPFSTSPFFMVINKDAFEKADALQYVNQEGDRAWTTENFVKALEALNKAGMLTGNVFCNGQGCDQGTRALVANLYSSETVNAEKTRYTLAETEEGKKALTLLKDLIDKNLLDFGPDIAGGDEIKLFVEKVLNMAFCWGTSAAKGNKDNIKFNTLNLPFPSDDGVPALEYLVNGFCVFDKGDADRAAASKLFIQFLCDSEEVGKDVVLASGAFPVRKSYGNLYEGNADYELMESWIKYYSPYYNTMDNFNEMRVQWWTMLQAYLSGQQDLDTATKTFTDLSNPK